jgi:imidazolonepropionase
MEKCCYTHIKNLYGIEAADEKVSKVAGKEMSRLASIENAYLVTQGEKIESWGSMAQVPQDLDKYISLKNKLVLPAWVDSHTHIVWAGSREGEFVDRIQGLSYEEIAKKGGGILNSAERLQNTEEEELFDSASQRLEEVIAFGTGAIEIKSGYGLTEEAEYKMLRVIQKLKNQYDIPIKSTFLGAHAIPKEFQSDRSGYIDLLTKKMIPHIAAEGLADYCDVFCDRGFFTPEETDHILKVAAKNGLPGKIHANELDYSGGIQVGVKNQARSVDHLECTGDEEISVLKNSDTMPTLLPGTAFFLGLDYAPARKMIDAGLAVALASDYNPGSTPSGRMPFIISLACIKMNMLPSEAIQAATINSAYALHLESELGTLKPGKYANFIVTKDISSIDFMAYAYGSDHIDSVYIKGRRQ